ncbi:MAG: hypothetical protein IPO83_05415 [Chitinophagaceae bacterium]|nr:hypothetical protein [Chitinophagaceae bacterium]
MKKIMSLSLPSVLIPLSGFAHPGHGITDGYTITHYFAEPEHLVVILCAAVLIIAGSVFFRKKEKRNDL